MKVLYYIFAVLGLGLAAGGTWKTNSAAPQVITVFAGNDQVICQNQSLLISGLGAYVSGDVSDGDWITFGDGRFQPGNLLTVRYSTAQNGVTYVPGPNDKALGFFRLMLISDAPVGGSPQQKVTDEVMVTFQAAPPIFCSSGFSISLNEACSQKVDATMLTANPVQPFSSYIITLFNADNTIIPGNTLTKNHIGKEITFKLGHNCTSNTCWGKFTVADYFPPSFVCKNDTVTCLKPVLPDSIGFPLPPGAYVDTIINKKYIVKNWDVCSDVTLEFKDEVVKANCDTAVDRRITRKWKATDASGNMSSCNQLIVVRKIKLSDVVFPPNYDGHDKPAFECRDTFPMLANGYPSPDTTGTPLTGTCGNLQYTMTDVPFALCGTSYKLARNWFVIDWCTSESVAKNQIIHVQDSRGPQFICPDSLSLETGPYACKTEREEVPMPAVVTDCSDYQMSVGLYGLNGAPLSQYVVQQGGNYYLEGLPYGEYILVYTATDDCGNTSECEVDVTVHDKTEPFAVCDQVTKVALDNTGRGRLFANSLDDGSSDNCGIAGFRARKMTNQCGFGTGWGTYLDFCCAETGTSVMVALEVTDIHGNSNTCMVEVRVEDKIPPTLTCPPNLTLECSDAYDLNNLGVFGKVVTKPADVKNIYLNNYYHNGLVGKDGLASDNCSVTVTSSYRTDITCYKGYIYRTFVATDAAGRKDSCTQTITILNPDPFDAGDITWPLNYEANGCKSSQTQPDVTGKPVFTNADCGTIAASYEDQPFFIADGACLKIIRTWTVVDWCQFAGTGSPGRFGPYIQIIKLHNTVKPQFTTPCRDTVVCSYDSGCATGEVVLSMAATDDCTETADLLWAFSVDVDADGSPDTIGQNSTFAGDLPLGSHTITWTVSDQCGNTVSCKQNVTVRDCKKPTPYCRSSVTVTLMQALAANTVWARDFDLGSSDNCTAVSDLEFTFGNSHPVETLKGIEHYFEGQGQLSTLEKFEEGLAQKWIPASNSSGLRVDCDDIPNGKEAVKSLEMMVTDHNGNTDFCMVELIIQDNAGVCPDVITSATISGRILTENDKVARDVAVQYTGPETNGNVSINNVTGSYAVPPLDQGRDYVVKPSLGGDPLTGVSTLDLVKIQRHILGLETFDSPYKYIAADVNGSSSVTASDLVELRKLILGITDKFPKSLPPWVFVRKHGGIPDPAIPFQYADEYEALSLETDISDADFIAVKLGDVNLSAVNINQPDAGSRAADRVIMYVSRREESGRVYLDFTFEEDIDMDALQVFLDTPGSTLTDAEFVSDVEFITDEYINRDKVSVVMYSPEPRSLKAGQKVFSLLTDQNPHIWPLLAGVGTSEVYVDGKSRKIILLPKQTQVAFSLLHNPVQGSLHIRSDVYSGQAALDYRVYTTEGRSVASGTIAEATLSEFAIELPGHLRPGLYLLDLTTSGSTQTLRFILIR